MNVTATLYGESKVVDVEAGDTVGDLRAKVGQALAVGGEVVIKLDGAVLREADEVPVASVGLHQDAVLEVDSIDAEGIWSQYLELGAGDTANDFISAVRTGNIAVLQLVSMGHMQTRKVTIQVLAHALSQDNSLASLSLSCDYIGPDEATTISSALAVNTTITALDLGKNSVLDAGAVALASALKANTALVSLDLRSNTLSDAAATAIAEAMHDNRTLTHLYLGYNNIGDSGANDLAQALRVNSTLTLLDLYNSYGLGDDGVTGLGHAIQENGSLDTLQIGSSGIGDRGVAALSQCTKRLSCLELKAKISTCGGSAIAEALADRDSVLESLYLDLVNTSDANIAEAISDSLCVNTTLSSLHLVNAVVGDSGACRMATALRVNATLTHLTLSNASIADSGAFDLATSLRSNATLSALHLSDNLITDTGAISLACALRTNAALTKLNLCGNEITISGTTELAAANSAASLDLDLTIATEPTLDDSPTLCRCLLM